MSANDWTMNKRCFVIMPFTAELNSIYEKLKSICERLNFECRRADKIAIGSISKGIFEEIFYSDVVIADLTFANPNVYYELAVSHCIGRKTILISQDEKIPFDISQDYVIKYNDTVNGGIILESQVERLLKHILNGRGIDNPAQMFLPKSREEEKLEYLSDMSKEILIALAESRKIEIEIVSEKAFLISPNSGRKIKEDLEKLDRLIEKIKQNK